MSGALSGCRAAEACAAQGGLTSTTWDGNTAHPRTHNIGDINAALFSWLRKASLHTGLDLHWLELTSPLQSLARLQMCLVQKSSSKDCSPQCASPLTLLTHAQDDQQDWLQELPEGDEVEAMCPTQPMLASAAVLFPWDVLEADLLAANGTSR